MTDRLEPYPTMKDSGVSWLGDVPAHWEAQRLGRVGRFSKGNGGTKEDDAEYGVPCIRYGDLYTHHRFFVTESRACVAPETAAAAYTPLRYGDVLFASSGETIHEIGKSAINLILGLAYCGGDVIIFRPSIEADARFLGYATDYPQAAHQKACMGRGITVMHVYASELKHLSIPLPPIAEQAAIVRFLDHVDRRIRRYIRDKEKLIAVLEEHKQALIHQAVTGQIDVRTGKPYPAYKLSSAEWLGEIPVGWTVVRLKFVASRIVDCLHATPKYSEDGQFPAIRTADISPGTVHVSSARRVDTVEYHRWTERLEPMPGDVLYSREGERFGIAACVPGGVRLCISQRMMVFRIREEQNPTFVMWVLNSMPVLAQACQYIMGSTAPHVNVSTIRDFCFALPGRDEQDRLVESIENATQGHDAAVAGANRSIAYLEEYRSRLIADVVTGKLDVRAVAARLPETDPLAPQTDGDHVLAGSAESTSEDSVGMIGAAGA